MPVVIAIAVGAVCAAAVAFVALSIRRRANDAVQTARIEADALVRSARHEAAAAKRAAETAVREQMLEVRAAAETDTSAAIETLTRREEGLTQREHTIAERAAELDARGAELRQRDDAVKSDKDRARSLRHNAERYAIEMIEALEARAGHRAAAVSERIASNMIDDARAEAENTLRTVDAHSGADPEIAKQAQRIMGIASGRYRKHFLTERSNSNISIANAIADKLSADDARLLHVLEQVSNVKLQLHESGESVRLEGLDGVGREIARRALARLSKRNPPKSLDSDPEGWANKIRANLMREIETLGKRAFKVLQIPRAHPEIVDLVGRLNYRTSYTQNQWLHAVEASFLAGMMASELQLDEALARRATLMHDIGKALTHEIDGSHAVIGADIARRLGEDEVVANAIGAHHGDEPHNSVYAYLVAAADAMSGARPGARRELTELYSMRLNDLERIGQSYRGVDRAFAVHGGRELRVYVRQSSVSDAQAVELSGEIAEQIADEMTFPGQIKVTVIREFEAVATAH